MKAAVILPPGEPSANPGCGYRPSAHYVGGPLAGRRAAALRRKDGPVHPLYRDPTGKALSAVPASAHYVIVGTGWDQFYDYRIGGAA